jgi:hypothetical protein
MNIDFASLTDNWQIILILAGTVLLITSAVAIITRLRKKNKELELSLKCANIEKEIEDAFLKSVNNDLQRILQLIDDANKQHQDDLAAQASIADANIKRYRDDIKCLKDKNRKRAMKLAINESPVDVVDRAKEYYNFLIGKG